MTTDTATIKMSCRNLWKVYAEQAAPYFKNEVDNADPATLSRRMREDGAIPAAANVSALMCMRGRFL
jgi:glycine betaine/proline transport system ATP-binding protein